MPEAYRARIGRPPSVVVLAGPNGAGKSTAAPALLRGRLAVAQFVNADTIARGLAGFAPDTAAMRAGRIMLARLKELAAARQPFAFETTLASRSFAPWLSQLTANGWAFHLVYVWLRSPELALARIADRVRLGGHGVPEDTVRRRYFAGTRNFWQLYRPLTTTWRVYDNSTVEGMRLLGWGTKRLALRVEDPVGWERFKTETRHDP